MSVNIHPSAVVAKSAELGKDVVIGPFSIVEDDVIIGDGTALDAHVIVGRGVKIGRGNKLFTHCVIGRAPQILGLDDKTPIGGLQIGDGNSIREFVTIHPSMHHDGNTVIGSDNLLMIGVHLGHDCVLGDKIVISNYTQISGHCHIQTGAWLSGMVAVHQFCTIGKWCYAAGCAGIGHDVPPFMIVSGQYPLRIRAVNKRGMRRAGLTEQQQRQVEEAFGFIWRADKPVMEQVKLLAQRDNGLDDNVRAIVELMLNSGKQRFGRHLELYR